MIPRVRIEGLASSLPSKKITSTQLEERIREHSKNITLPAGSIEILTGVKERRVLDEHLNASDLATDAAKKALKKAQLDVTDIDCLLFASACSDILEPATANIVQQHLKATCPAFDIKNACNSFLNGMEVAESFIVSGKYKRVLVVNGEVPSRAVRYSVKNKDQLRKSFAGYTLGDAGAAMILGPSDGTSGILYSEFSSYGEHWELSTYMGGGTRYPRDVEKTYFEGETAGLKDVFIKIGPKQIHHTLKIVGWSVNDIDKIIVHQVSAKSFNIIADQTKLPMDKIVIVLPELGNMISASVPVALDHAQHGGLKSGDKILLIGLASGISIGTFALVW